MSGNYNKTNKNTSNKKSSVSGNKKSDLPKENVKVQISNKINKDEHDERLSKRIG